MITKRYIVMAVDPLHVGTGGYRLGMVDLSIVREPGTNIPKIPGTTLHGAIRLYAAYQYNKVQCAGSSISEKPCGDAACPVCYTFGYIKDASSGKRGMVNISDARILFFPVYSLKGPVWVSTPPVLRECGIQVENTQDVVTSMDIPPNKVINLGWLMVKIVGKTAITLGSESEEWNQIKDRIVVVPEPVFSQVVNSNLEIRTSVSISPETGTAEDSALFTYEAIPRSTFLWADVVEDDYWEKFPKTGQTFKKEKLPHPWNTPIDVVESGLTLCEHLGVGGMGTRGFGRIRLVTDWEV